MPPPPLRLPVHSPLRQAAQAYFTLLKALIAALLAVMVILVFGNVVLRYAFNQGITESEELGRLCFLWITFLGATVALREYGHIGVDSLVKRLSPSLSRATMALALALMLGISALLLLGAWQQMVINLDVTAPATGLPMASFYLPCVVFAASAVLIILADLWGVLRDPGHPLLVREGLEGMADPDVLPHHRPGGAE